MKLGIDRKAVKIVPRQMVPLLAKNILQPITANAGELAIQHPRTMHTVIFLDIPTIL